MNTEYHTPRKKQEKNKVFSKSSFPASHTNRKHLESEDNKTRWYSPKDHTRVKKKKFIPSPYTLEECSVVPGITKEAVLRWAQNHQLRRTTWQSIPLTFNSTTLNVVNNLEKATRGKFVEFVNLILSLKFSSTAFKVIYASRKFYADRLGVSIVTISRYIKRAKRLRLIDGYNVINETVEIKINTELYNPLVQRRFSHIFPIFAYLMTVVAFGIAPISNGFERTDTQLKKEYHYNSNLLGNMSDIGTFGIGSLTNSLRINSKPPDSAEKARSSRHILYNDLNSKTTTTETWESTAKADRECIRRAKEKAYKERKLEELIKKRKHQKRLDNLQQEETMMDNETVVLAKEKAEQERRQQVALNTQNLQYSSTSYAGKKAAHTDKLVATTHKKLVDDADMFSKEKKTREQVLEIERGTEYERQNLEQAKANLEKLFGSF